VTEIGIANVIVTPNRRLIVVQNGWGHKTASCYLATLPTLTKEGGDSNDIGTLRLRFWIEMVRSNRLGRVRRMAAFIPDLTRVQCQ
jgi:hypothetical protein